MNKKRVLWIDAAKGIGITLMILGHMKISDDLLAFLYSFHMPLFVIISGFLFRPDRPLSDQLKRRSKALILPYLYTNIAALFVRFLLLAAAGAFSISGALGIAKAQTKATLLGMGFARNLFTNTESVGPIWFVPFLFCICLLYGLLKKVCIQKYIWSELIEFFIVISLSFAGYYIGTKIAFLPWSFDAALVALPLFYTGTKLQQFRFFEWKYCSLCALLLAAFWLLLYHKSGMVALVTRAYVAFPFCLLTAVAGSIFILFLLRSANSFTKASLLLKPLAWYGQHSMLLLGIHTIELWHIGWLDTIQSKCPNLFCSYLIYLLLLTFIACGILLFKKWSCILFNKIKHTH